MHNHHILDNMSRIHICLVLLVLAASNLSASEVLFRNFSTKDGLPDNSVTCITQDKFGFMWMGSKCGVSWYDGSRFIKLRSQVVGEVFGSMTTDIVVDDNNTLYVASIKGLASRDLNTGVERLLVDLTDISTIRFLTPDGEGSLWMVIGYDLCRVKPETRELQKYDIRASAICRSELGYIWVVSEDGELLEYNPRNDSFVTHQLRGVD